MKYVVNLAVTARMRVEVEADSKFAAICEANGVMSEADCGPLSDIDWEVKNVEDEDGRILPNEEEF